MVLNISSKIPELSAYLIRLKDDGKQTLGDLSVFDGVYRYFMARTLELPWKENQTDISCIPKGIYDLNPRITPERGKHFEIMSVPNREKILIHSGNYISQTRGCILVGKDFVDLNKDGFLDVTSSVDTLAVLAKIVQVPVKITII